MSVRVCPPYKREPARDKEDTRVYALLSVPLGAKGKYNNLATIVSEPHHYSHINLNAFRIQKDVFFSFFQ